MQNIVWYTLIVLGVTVKIDPTGIHTWYSGVGSDTGEADPGNWSPNCGTMVPEGI